jgi:hypothetical protein
MVNLKAKAVATGAAMKWNFDRTLVKAKDTKNFRIEKKRRFGARFFQIVLAAMSYIWLSNQNRDLISKLGLGDKIGAFTAFAVISPIISIFCVLLHVLPWFGSKWTSRRILLAESFGDLFMSFGWLCCFGVIITQSGTGCVTAAVEGCANINLLIAWAFFLFISWLMGFVFDIVSWYQALYGEESIDPNIAMELRKATRSRV